MINRRLQNRIRSDIHRNPDIYLKEIFCGRDSALPLDEITLSMARLTGIEIRNQSLIKVVASYEKKHGKKLLIAISQDQSPKYCYNTSSARDYGRE
jgi:hypothetical protein